MTAVPLTVTAQQVATQLSAHRAQPAIVDQIDAVIDQSLMLTVGRFNERSTNVAHLPLDRAAAAAFRQLCRQTRDWIAAADGIAYAATAELGQGEYFSVSDEPTIEELAPIRELGAPPASLAPTSPADLDPTIRAYGVTVGDSDAQRLLFVKRTNPQMRHRAGRFLAVGRERLAKLDDPVFAFAHDFDLVLGPGWAAILNQSQFERLFKEAGLVNRHIATWISGITAHIPMSPSDSAALTEVALRDSRTWRRLRDIKRSDHLRNVTIENIARYAESMGIAPDNIIRDGHLVFRPEQRFTFLHLLNEDLYVGPLTGQSFESHRKTSV